MKKSSALIIASILSSIAIMYATIASLVENISTKHISLEKLLEKQIIGMLIGVIDVVIIAIIIVIFNKYIDKEDTKKVMNKLKSLIINTILFVPVVIFGIINIYSNLILNKNILKLCIENAAISIFLPIMAMILLIPVFKVIHMVFGDRN